MFFLSTTEMFMSNPLSHMTSPTPPMQETLVLVPISFPRGFPFHVVGGAQLHWLPYTPFVHGAVVEEHRVPCC
jgi:hypothetical protein